MKHLLLLISPLILACDRAMDQSSSLHDHVQDEEYCVSNEGDIDQILENWGGIDAENVGGMTPLLTAIRCRNIDDVRALLDAGADANLVARDMLTPAIEASRSGSVQIMDMLIAEGVDLYFTPQNGQDNAIGAAFDAGFLTDNWSVYEHLLELGIDVNAVTGNNELRDLVFKSVALNRFQRANDLLDRGYERDLPRLLRMVKRGIGPASSEEREARERLIRRVELMLLEQSDSEG